MRVRIGCHSAVGFPGTKALTRATSSSVGGVCSATVRSNDATCSRTRPATRGAYSIRPSSSRSACVISGVCMTIP